jgi:hypothetical protein
MASGLMADLVALLLFAAGPPVYSGRTGSTLTGTVVLAPGKSEYEHLKATRRVRAVIASLEAARAQRRSLILDVTKPVERGDVQRQLEQQSRTVRRTVKPTARLANWPKTPPFRRPPCPSEPTNMLAHPRKSPLA